MKKRLAVTFIFTLLTALLIGQIFAAPQGGVVHAQATSITFDNMTLLSPDGQQVVYVTAQNLGMTGSAIWLANANGSQSAVLVAGDATENSYWVTNPIWSPDSQQVAYVKAVKQTAATGFVSYRYEIWAIQSDGSNNRLLTNSLFRPSLGYGGQTSLVWDATDVEFSGGGQLSYAINVNTLAVSIMGAAELGALPNAASIPGVPAYSQHNENWAGDIINAGNGCYDFNRHIWRRNHSFGDGARLLAPRHYTPQ